MKCVVEGFDRVPRVTAAAHSHTIKTVASRVVALDCGKGHSVLHHDAIPADESLEPDPAKLMNA